jgi:hypothetical protein
MPGNKPVLHHAPAGTKLYQLRLYNFICAGTKEAAKTPARAEIEPDSEIDNVSPMGNELIASTLSGISEVAYGPNHGLFNASQMRYNQAQRK